VNTPVPELIRVAAARWAIEECLQTEKNEAGLDHYQVRGYRAWYAHITLAMLAAAYLAATRAQEVKRGTHVRPQRRARPHIHRHLSNAISWSTWR
jgi:SRSO17 transposase